MKHSIEKAAREGNLWLTGWRDLAKPDHPIHKLNASVESQDRARLGEQYKRVLELMRDGRWRTLDDISGATGDPQASVSARLRDLRRDGWTVQRRRVKDGNGLHEYRMLQP